MTVQLEKANKQIKSLEKQGQQYRNLYSKLKTQVDTSSIPNKAEENKINEMKKTNMKLQSNLNKLYKFYDKSKLNEIKNGSKELGE